MKQLCLILLAFGVAFQAARGAESLNEALQKGLLEEEANQNLTAAIEAYQSVLTSFAEERKIAATAAFRLGECYRKEGKTNEALAQFSRVTRDFPDQTPLVTLSQKYLVDHGQPNAAAQLAAGAAGPTGPGLDSEKTKLVREEMALVQKQIEILQRAIQNGRANTDDLVHLKRDLLGLSRKLPENASAAQQQALIEQEIQLVQQLLVECRKKIEVGIASPADEIPFQRDLLQLRRELIAAQEGAQPRFQNRLNAIVKRAETGTPELADDEEAKSIKGIQELIVNSPDLINARDAATGFTPLQEAARKGQLVVARFLLDNHADVNATTRPGQTEERTALHLASAAGHKAMVELLLARGAAVNSQDRYGSTPLHEAARNGFRAVVQVLLAKGAEINLRNQNGEAPLHAAITGVQRGAAEFLLENKADLNAQNNSGTTPLILAVNSKRLELVQMLLTHKPDLNLKTINGTTALTESVAQGTVALSQLLLDQGADPNVNGIKFSGSSPSALRMAPLHSSATTGDLRLGQALLAHHADVNLRDDLGRTPLLVAVTTRNEPAIQLLLANGADPNIEGSDGSSPLPMAVANGSQAIARALLDKGAKANALLPGGGTPLFTAAEQGQDEVVGLLLAHGADPNAKSPEGFTPLHVAAVNGKTNIIDLLLSKGADINRQDALGNTPLHYAAARFSRPTVQLLLDRGATSDIRNDENQTPGDLTADVRYRQGSRWGIPQRSPSPVPPTRGAPSAYELEIQRLLQKRPAPTQSTNSGAAVPEKPGRF